MSTFLTVLQGIVVVLGYIAWGAIGLALLVAIIMAPVVFRDKDTQDRYRLHWVRWTLLTWLVALLCIALLVTLAINLGMFSGGDDSYHCATGTEYVRVKVTAKRSDWFCVVPR